LTKYLKVSQEELKRETTPQELKHEPPILGDLNTIAGGFSGGGCLASSRKRYARAVMSLDIKKYEWSVKPSLCFTVSDWEDIFPHEDDPVVISVITIGQKVHRISSTKEVWLM